MKIGGILFDKDGTLFDFQRSWGDWFATFISDLSQGNLDQQNALAKALRFNQETRCFDRSSLFIHDTLDEIVTQMLPHLPEWKFDTLFEHGRAEAAKVAQIPTTPLQPLFDTLRANGIQLGIATNDNIAPCTAQLERAGVDNRFDFIAGYDSGFGAKPGTGMLDAFCNQTKLPSAQVFMVGDSAHDMTAGRAAGMKTIAVLTGPASRIDLAPLADITLNNIGEIPALLKN